MRYLSILIIVLFSSSVKAQPNQYRILPVDSLKKVLTASKEDTFKVKTLCRLGESYQDLNDPDQSALYLKEALELSKKLDFLDGQADATVELAVYYAHTFDTVNAKKYFTEAIRLAEQTKNDYAIAYANEEFARFYLHQQEFSKAIPYNDVAIRHFISNGDKDNIAGSYIMQGNLRAQSFKYEKALASYLSADSTLNTVSKLNPSQYQNIAGIYYNIAGVQDALNQKEKSFQYMKKALEYAKKGKNPRQLGHMNKGLGDLLQRSGNLKKALECYLACIEPFESTGRKDALPMVFIYIGDIYAQLGQPEKSLPSYEKAVAYATETASKPDLAAAYGGMGRFYTKVSPVNLPKAINYLKKAEALVKGSDDLFTVEDIYSDLADAYKLTGNYKDALHYSEQAASLRDSMVKAETTNNTNELLARFESEKKELEITNLTTENKLAVTTRNASIGIGVVLILSIFFGGLYISKRRSFRMKQNYTHQLVLTQEDERKRIAKELHDSVGQNILFIRNKIVKLKEEELLGSVDEALEEVRSISKDLYPNQLEKYGLAAAVDALAEKLKLSTGIFMSSDLSVIQPDLSPEKTITFYRIIQECVNNTMKHAQATALRVTASLRDNYLELVVQDNGVGFDKNNLATKAQRSFGLLNLEERVKLLNGKFNIYSAPNEGTRAVFLIPV